MLCVLLIHKCPLYVLLKVNTVGRGLSRALSTHSYRRLFFLSFIGSGQTFSFKWTIHRENVFFLTVRDPAIYVSVYIILFTIFRLVSRAMDLFPSISVYYLDIAFTCPVSLPRGQPCMTASGFYLRECLHLYIKYNLLSSRA